MLHGELPELRVPLQIQRGGIQRVHHAGLGQRSALVRRGRKHDSYVTIGFILVVVQIQEDGEATYGAWEDCEAGCPVAGSSAASTAVNIGLYIYLLCMWCNMCILCIHLGA